MRRVVSSAEIMLGHCLNFVSYEVRCKVKAVSLLNIAPSNTDITGKSR